MANSQVPRLLCPELLGKSTNQYNRDGTIPIPICLRSQPDPSREIGMSKRHTEGRRIQLPTTRNAWPDFQRIQSLYSLDPPHLFVARKHVCARRPRKPYAVPFPFGQRTLNYRYFCISAIHGQNATVTDSSPDPNKPILDNQGVSVELGITRAH